MGKEYIADGALCICKHGTGTGVLAVKKKTKTINGGKMIASDMELGDVFQPPECVTCTINPLFPKPCKSNIIKWSNPAKNEKLQGGARPLLPESKATCSTGSPDCVEIIFHGQFELLGAPQMNAATNVFQNELNPLAGITPTSNPIPFSISLFTAKPQEKYEVESIKIVSDLDLGSANDGKGATDKKGMIYGKTYQLEVGSFKNGKEPPKHVKINWEYTYTEEDKNGEMVAVIGGFQKSVQRQISFKVNDVTLLGKEITFYAYIEDKTKEAEKTIQVHYRFRFLDRKTVIKQLEDRVKTPWKINQEGTPLCGMAAIFYLFAKYQASDYKKVIEDLHRTGYATFNGYTIKPFKGIVRIPNPIPFAPPHQELIDVSEFMYNMRVQADNFPANMPEADWLALAVTRSKESTWIPFVTTLIYRGEKEKLDILQILAVNWPDMLESVCKKLLGYKNVRQVDLSYLSIASVKLPKIRKELLRRKPLDSVKMLIKIDELYNKGHDILMMIDYKMLEGIVTSDLSDIFNNRHWVVYEGNLEMFDVNKDTTMNIQKIHSVKFDIFTWGENIKKSRISKRELGISLESYHSTRFGYIDCWNTEYIRGYKKIIDSPIDIPSDGNKDTNSYGLV